MRSPSSVNIYASFDSFAVQRQMLVSAATELLPKRSVDVFRATLTVIERAAKERHRFAHWVWGSFIDHELKDRYVLLADPKHLWRLRVRQMKHHRRHGPGEATASATAPAIDRRQIIVYREDDLLRIRQQMMVAEVLAFGLQSLVRAKSKRLLGIQRQLLAQPDVRTEFDKLRLRKTEHPTVARKRQPLSNRAKRAAASAMRGKKSEV